MIAVGYGVVTAYLATLLAAAWAALRLGRQVSRSRAAAVFVFLWGLLASLSIVLLVAAALSGAGWSLPGGIHLHPTEFHVHYGAAEETLFVICHHIPYVGLTLPSAIVLVPLLSFGIPIASFAVNQTCLHSLHRRLLRHRDPALTVWLRDRMAALEARPGWEVLVVDSPRREALSYALVSPQRRPLRMAKDVVVVTKGLCRFLPEDELLAAVAHECAHLDARDNRYLAFFRTLGAIVFFDPVVLFLSRSLCREAEHHADARAARVTGNPLALARALLRLYLADREGPGAKGAALDGAHGAERVRRLVALAGEMAQGAPAARPEPPSRRGT